MFVIQKQQPFHIKMKENHVTWSHGCGMLLVCSIYENRTSYRASVFLIAKSNKIVKKNLIFFFWSNIFRYQNLSYNSCSQFIFSKWIQFTIYWKRFTLTQMIWNVGGWGCRTNLNRISTNSTTRHQIFSLLAKTSHWLS